MLDVWLAAAALWAGPAADGLKLRLGTDVTSVAVGEEITAEFEVERTGPGGVPEPKVPPSVTKAFEIGICSSRSGRSFGTFRASVRTETLSCALTAKTEGKHKLVFSVNDGKKTARSNAITISVGVGAEPEILDPTTDAPTQAIKDVFLWPSVDRTRAFVGQQVTYKLDVYEGRRFVEPQMRTPPNFQDFFAEELQLPEVTVREIEGRAYRVRPGIRRALFPQRTGTLTVGAAEVAVRRGKIEKSTPIEIEVVPLPAEGQPPGFPANNVGQYSIDAAVDRDDVQPGEPFTLTVTIKGNGHIDVVDPGPWPKVPGVRRYDPKVDVERQQGDIVGGTRTYEFLLIPERSGKVTIPAHELPYFDPAGALYEIAKSKPIEVLVGGDPNAIVDDADAAGEPATAVEPLAPIIAVETVPRRVPRARWLDNGRWTYGMLAVPLFALFGLGAGVLWRRLGPDDAARNRSAIRRRRRALTDEANAAADSGDGFHGIVAKLLQEVALERAGPEGVGVPRPQLMRLLEDRGVEPGARKQLGALLEQCDAARFASESGGAGERRTLLDEALALVRTLSKGVAG